MENQPFELWDYDNLWANWDETLTKPINSSMPRYHIPGDTNQSQDGHH